MFSTGPGAVVGLVLASSLLTLPLSAGFNCGVCNPLRCAPEPLDCNGGTTKDICDCCQVCTKLVNESCGGKYGMLGKCAPGLKCFISPVVGQAITGHEEGICKAYDLENCTHRDCDSAVTMQCPKDSDLIFNSTALDDRFYCQCNMTYCSVTSCAPGFQSVLLYKGLGIPSKCCDEFVCKRSATCQSVICPPVNEKECPTDSFKPAGTLTKDGCCPLHQSCQCKEQSKCPPVSCPDGLRVYMIDKAANVPGSCCDKFECVNDTGLSCFYEEQEFHDGESWQLDKCTTCTCRNGLTFCKTKTCNGGPLCGWMVIPEGECCPVCKGCVSDSGHLYNNSEVWKENDCMTCQCDAGKVLCQAEMCAVPCANPRQVPGQCCPVCDDETIMVKPELCPSVENCSLNCPQGLQMANDALCFLCQCKPEPCNLNCKYGFAKDFSGQDLCECAQPTDHCPNLETCTKRCTYGYRKSRNGCLKCRCNRCPPFNCTKRCLHGYLLNDQGCQLCKCREAPIQLSTPVMTALVPGSEDGHACLSLEGQRHEDGESWHDGCRLCFCKNGHEMCSLILCPVPRCTNPVFRIGDCCPSCPGVTVVSSSGQKQACKSANGHHLVEGETWQLDACTQCICHAGTILCESHTCPPVLCHYPVKPVNQCCAVCKGKEGTPQSPALSLRPCKGSSGVTYKHGDKWQSSPCQSCACRHGQIHCYSQMCPPLNCNRTVLQKGKCCSTCLDVSQPGVCTVGDLTYSSGEMWLSDNCTECMCVSGKVLCIPVSCPQLTCSVMIRRPSECCPVCHDMHTSTAIMPDEKTNDNPQDKDAGVPTEDIWSKESYVIAIAILGVLLSMTIIAILVLILVLLRRRHTGEFKMKPDGTIVTDMKIRPKSTNLEYQGVMPFLLEQVPPSKPVNNEKNVLDKKYTPLGPVITAERGNKLSDISGKQFVNSSSDQSKDMLNGSYKTNKTFEPV